MAYSRRSILEKKAEAKLELIRRKIKGGNFWAYCLYMDNAFFSKRSAVLKEVAGVLQKVYEGYRDGRVVRAAISLPPRTGKSYILSMFCSFMLGHFPKESIMRNTCTKPLYNKLSKDTRNIVGSEKWFDLFGVEMKTTGVDTWDLATAKQCSYFGGGTGGTIIGFGASMLDITDDLYTGYTAAMSETINEATKEWAEANRGSRVERGCCSIDVGTRWRKSDIIGVNLERKWYTPGCVIKKSALTEDGKSFCEEVQTTEHYLEEKDNISEEIWSAEYQQEPIDIKGRLYDPDELNYYDFLPSGGVDANIGVCDTADEGDNHLSFPFAKLINGKYYIYDWLFTKENMDITEPLVKGSISTNGVTHVRFESNNGGKLFAKGINNTVKCAVSWRTTTTNKETRILVDSAWIKKNCVFLRRAKLGYVETIVYKTVNNEKVPVTEVVDGERVFVKEKKVIKDDYYRAFQQMISYVKGVKGQKDDAPDSISMLYRFSEELGLNVNLNEVKQQRGETWGSIPITNLSQIKL